MWTGQGWNLHLRRNLNDWEMGNIVAFHDTLAQFSNLTREEDKVVWKIGSKGVFSVKSAYKDLNQSNSNDRMELWPWRMIWRTKIPNKFGKLFLSTIFTYRTFHVMTSFGAASLKDADPGFQDRQQRFTRIFLHQHLVRPSCFQRDPVHMVIQYIVDIASGIFRVEAFDEVKSNLEELEEVNKEGLTNLELKLTEALSSLHREFETLKRQVDETATAGVAGPVTVQAAKGRDNRSKNVPPRGDSSRTKNRPVPNRGSDTRGNNRNQPSNFRKNYEDRKKGAPHREGCYICGETTHAARYCPSLSKLNAIVAAQKQQEQVASQTGGPSGEQGG
uniref:CCHC-type domain-containing protein n=1 Tax=Solanum tuberosum TaxID=4113 RepID=M1DJF6_SOLTU